MLRNSRSLMSQCISTLLLLKSIIKPSKITKLNESSDLSLIWKKHDKQDYRRQHCHLLCVTAAINLGRPDKCVPLTIIMTEVFQDKGLGDQVSSRLNAWMR